MVKRIGLALGVLLAGAALAAAPATTPAAVAASTCSVSSGMIYNIADGSTDEKRRWHTLLTCLIDASPAGATITITTYSWDDAASANALLEADRRGVNVRLVMFNLRYEPYGDDFQAEFNDKETAGSWFKSCIMSCLGPNDGEEYQHHAKIFTFSKINTPAGTASYITTMGTGNPTGGALRSHNTWRTIVNNKAMYDPLVARIVRMRTDKPYLPSKAETVTLSSTVIYLFPQKSSTPDLFVDTIKGTYCSGATPIRVAMYQWTAARKGIADALAARKRGGCDVRVIINLDTALLHPDVLSVLMGANIPVYNGLVDGMYMHAKDVYIGGSRDIVLTGSQNATGNAIHSNDESQMKITHAATADQYLAMWNYWVTKAQRVSSAKVLVSPKPGDRTPAVKIPTSNNPDILPENQ